MNDKKRLSLVIVLSMILSMFTPIMDMALAEDSAVNPEVHIGKIGYNRTNHPNPNEFRPENYEGLPENVTKNYLIAYMKDGTIVEKESFGYGKKGTPFKPGSASWTVLKLDPAEIDYFDVELMDNNNKVIMTIENVPFAPNLVKDMIDELPSVEDLTLDNKEEVEEAREAYNELSRNAEKELVTNIDKLITLEERIKELEESEPYIEKVTHSIYWNGMDYYRLYNYKNLPESTNKWPIHYKLKFYFEDGTNYTPVGNPEKVSGIYLYNKKQAEEITHFDVILYQPKGQFGPYEEIITIENVPFDGPNEEAREIHYAQEMVGRAERSLLQEDVDAAWPVVNALPDSEDKDKLIERLNFVQSAIDVETSIRALPEVEELTLEDKEAVEAARVAYEALHSNPKQRISKKLIAKLEALEARLEELEEEEPEDPKDPNSIRIINYNIQAGIGNDGNYDIRRTAEVIRKSGADIVGLTEVDVNFSDRSNFDDQVEILADELGMYSFYGPIYDMDPLEEGQPRRKYGMAILSKYPITEAVNYEITRLSTQDENPEPRPMPGFPGAKIDVDGKVFSFYVTHLDYRGDPMVREMQVDDTLNIFSEVAEPKILVGDFNALPGAPEIAPMFEYLNDSWELTGVGDGYTFPVNNPSKRIDYILVNDGIEVVKTRVIDTEASDHFPVVTDIKLKEINENDLNSAQNVVNLIKELPKFEDITLGDSGAVEEAREAYNNLTNEQRELVIDYRIKKAEEKIAELEKETVNAVIKMIEEIPDLEDLTLEDKEAVANARKARNALTPKQMGLIPEEYMRKLRASEARIKELERAVDREAANRVIKLIGKIPPIEELTLEDKPVVEEARAAYNELTASQKSMIINIPILKLAEERIGELEKEVPAPEVDKTKLAEEIGKAEKLNKQEYTEKTWGALEIALNSAKDIYQNKNVTQEEVDDAIGNLQKALEELELRTEEPEDPEEPESPEEPKDPEEPESPEEPRDPSENGRNKKDDDKNNKYKLEKSDKEVKGRGGLPRTGAANNIEIYLVGILLIVLGVGFRKKIM